MASLSLTSNSRKNVESILKKISEDYAITSPPPLNRNPACPTPPTPFVTHSIFNTATAPCLISISEALSRRDVIKGSRQVITIASDSENLNDNMAYLLSGKLESRLSGPKYTPTLPNTELEAYFELIKGEYKRILEDGTDERIIKSYNYIQELRRNNPEEYQRMVETQRACINSAENAHTESQSEDWIKRRKFDAKSIEKTLSKYQE